MTSTGGFHAADITGRMAVFGRLFGEQAGGLEPADIATADELVELLRARLPRSGGPVLDGPVFEAAAFTGEWVRARCSALWVAEGPFEPHLQATDASHAIVYLVPLVSVLRTASTAGYDGLASLLKGILEDVTTPAHRGSIEGLRVHPAVERARVIRWVTQHARLQEGSIAALWRRCAACATPYEEETQLPADDEDWESVAARAASILARRPFGCECGGPQGESTRFVMLRRHEGETRLCDIFATGTHSRVASWTLRGGQVVPFDATSLAPAAFDE